MRALVLERGRLAVRTDVPEPPPRAGEARVRVLQAGVCATDLALARGYMDYEGIPGHEFVGVALEGPLAGRRVVGEINAACGECSACRAGHERHCPARTVLGILRRAGAFAEVLRLPEGNLHAVPDGVSDDAATFCEPLAAALEIGEQVPLVAGARALVAGDGRLGLLCASVLARAGLAVTVAGRHPARAALLPAGVEHATGLLEPDAPPLEHTAERPVDLAGARSVDLAAARSFDLAAARSFDLAAARPFDLAVEATGDPAVLARVLGCVRPRGTVVLKTTSERAAPLDLAPLVVDEITLVGSRCGPFAPALAVLAEGSLPVERFVHARYPLAQAPAALARAGEPGVLKVMVEVSA